MAEVAVFAAAAGGARGVGRVGLAIVFAVFAGVNEILNSPSKPSCMISKVSTRGTRLLVAAGEAVAGLEELPPLVRRLVETASDILVISPVLVGRLRWLASDTDSARYEADERLGVVLGHVQELAPGAKARAQVGDETPLTAFGDAVRAFRPDHILVALRGADHAAWQEQGLIDAALEAFHVPIKVFEIDLAGQVSRDDG